MSAQIIPFRPRAGRQGEASVCANASQNTTEPCRPFASTSDAIGFAVRDGLPNIETDKIIAHIGRCDHNHMRLYPEGWRCAKCGYLYGRVSQ